MEISSLGIVGIGGVALIVVVLAILGSLVNRRFSAQALAVQRSEQRYRQLAESVQVVLWRGDVSRTRFSYINQEAEDLLGYPVRDWISTPDFWMDHLHPDDRRLAESCCQAAAKNQVPNPFEHRMIAADGRVVWLRTSVRLVAGDREATELVGVMTDITERKQAQELAARCFRETVGTYYVTAEASRAKSEFLAEIKRLNDRLHRENTRMSGELEVTQRLQQMMLPREEDMRQVASLDISGSMEPADEVGGDYYDVVSKDGGVFFGIGDVTGHGLESGVIAIMVQTAVRTLLASGPYERRKFFDVLNRVIYSNARRMNCDRNLTFTLLHYHDRLVTISGQHEEVLVVRSNGALERHDTLDLGFQLGLVEDISSFVGEAVVPLQSGDVMVAYTDGITEAMNGVGVAYGIDRLSEAVRISHGQPAEAIRRAVLSSLREYIGGQHLLDDISLLVIKPA